MPLSRWTPVLWKRESRTEIDRNAKVMGEKGYEMDALDLIEAVATAHKDISMRNVLGVEQEARR